MYYFQPEQAGQNELEKIVLNIAKLSCAIRKNDKKKKKRKSKYNDRVKFLLKLSLGL